MSSSRSRITRCRKNASHTSIVSGKYSPYSNIDRGYAFSQEAGQAPQITNSLLSKIKQGLQAKLTFTPNLSQTNNNYRPNTESINPNADGEGAIQGSFHPDMHANNLNQEII